MTVELVAMVMFTVITPSVGAEVVANFVTQIVCIETWMQYFVRYMQLYILVELDISHGIY